MSTPKSRTGFLISVSDCPVLWILKLQRETALSTIEAEINSLAYCCRELFPVMDMVEEIGSVVGLPNKDMSSMHVSVHKDNSDALILGETIPPSSLQGASIIALRQCGLGRRL
jgi:hypothetical protein